MYFWVNYPFKYIGFKDLLLCFCDLEKVLRNFSFFKKLKQQFSISVVLKYQYILFQNNSNSSMSKPSMVNLLQCRTRV